ncbi:MFS transporter [Candidatus Tisiphia endosymbiont of Oplodontha viridula]|uniref:MFS transporter n=1 Tax=Candidatus Tisiphia endosymbiont of Oplodontha viridula TaxID=3077925 RepID=UPI0035C8EA44
MVSTSFKEKPPYARKYNSWRIRILYSIIIGYSTFIFCRQNFNIAMPALMDNFEVTKTQLGWILTASSIVYGVGKLCNGFFSDRSNARIFMVVGLALVGIITLLSSFASSITLLGLLWILNNWFQSMGWPPATRMLTYWYASKELGMKWSLGATSNQIGGATTMIVCGYLIDVYGWKAAFIIPGIVALLISLFLFNRLRNSPNEVNLPIVEEYKECDISLGNNGDNLLTRQLIKIVFCNRLVWYVCFANMFVYIVRSGVIFWAPVFLRELKNITIAQAGLQVASYDILGLIGGVVAGWMSDKLFQGRRGPVGSVFMFVLAFTLILFWQIPNEYEIFSMIILALAGFFVSGPQVLIGVATADFTNKQAVGTANGLSGLFGYLGAALAGVCVGWISDNLGWNGVFLFFIFSAFLGAILFSLTWNYSSRKIA